jgi:hypothetical protein
MTRNYAAEYASRKERAAEAGTTVYRERGGPGSIVRAFGFESYSQYRASADRIKAEFQSLAKRDIWELGPPVEKSPLWNSMMQANSTLARYTPEQVARAAEKKESLLGRTARGRAIREDLRDLLGWKTGKGWGAVYYSAMRTLY